MVLIGYLSSLRIFESKYTEVGFSEFLNKFTYALFATISIKFFTFSNLLFAYLLGLAIKYRYLLFKSKLSPIKNIKHDYRLSRHAGYSSSISHLFLAGTSLIPMLTINQFFSLEDLGHYSMAVTVIFLPSAVLSISIGNIYFEKLIKNNNFFKSIFINTFFIAASLAIIIFTPFLFFSEAIFEFALGKEWIKSGLFASILVIPAFVGFITGCFDRTCFIAKNNLHAPVWHFCRMLFTLSACLFCINIDSNIQEFILILSFGQTLLYLADFVLQISYGVKLKKAFDSNKLRSQQS